MCAVLKPNGVNRLWSACKTKMSFELMKVQKKTKSPKKVNRNIGKTVRMMTLISRHYQWNGDGYTGRIKCS